jgi:hypothetical protein
MSVEIESAPTGEVQFPLPAVTVIRHLEPLATAVSVKPVDDWTQSAFVNA